MKYLVNSTNNFCRVFKLPKDFPEQFCFNGPVPINMYMVDWFNPVTMNSEDLEVDLKELEITLIPWIKEKSYMEPGRQYLVLFDFGACSCFTY